MASLSKRINADYPSPWSFEQICSLRNKNFCLTILWDQVAFFTVSPQSGWGSQLANFTSMHGSGLDIKMTEKQILTSKWPICLVYVIKVLDLVAFLSLSLSLPPFFPWWTSAIMSNLDQSYFKKVNVLITLEVKRADIMSGHLGIWPDKTYFWSDIVRWPAVISSPEILQISRLINVLGPLNLQCCLFEVSATWTLHTRHC